jgi:hypothetical protein
MFTQGAELFFTRHGSRRLLGVEIHLVGCRVEVPCPGSSPPPAGSVVSGSRGKSQVIRHQGNSDSGDIVLVEVSPTPWNRVSTTGTMSWEDHPRIRETVIQEPSHHWPASGDRRPGRPHVFGPHVARATCRAGTSPGRVVETPDTVIVDPGAARRPRWGVTAVGVSIQATCQSHPRDRNMLSPNAMMPDSLRDYQLVVCHIISRNPVPRTWVGRQVPVFPVRSG